MQVQLGSPGGKKTLIQLIIIKSNNDKNHWMWLQNSNWNTHLNKRHVIQTKVSVPCDQLDAWLSLCKSVNQYLWAGEAFNKICGALMSKTFYTVKHTIPL